MRHSVIWVAVMMIITACKNDSTEKVSTSYTATGVVVASAGGYEARIAAASDKVGTETVSASALSRITKNGGQVLIDIPEKVSGLPETTNVASLMADPEVKAALMGLDEAAAAALLVSKGVKTVIMHSKVTPSVDRGKRVLSRLYHHDQLLFFQLFRVGEGLYFYRVLDKPVSFNANLAKSSMVYIRHRLKGNPKAPIPDVKAPMGQWSFVATLRGQGRELAVAFAQDRQLGGAIEELVQDLERLHRRRVEYMGFPPLKDHIDDLKLELQLVTERAYIEPRDDKFLAEFWELGIDGAFMLTKDKKSRGVLPGSVSYTRALNRIDTFLKAAAKQGKMPFRRPWREEGGWLESFRTIHFAENDSGGITRLFRGVKIVSMDQVTQDSVRQGVVSAGEWYLSNIQPNGQVVYKFWPEENRYSNEYNFVRHTLSTWNLVQAWEMEQRPEFLEGARRSLDWSNEHLEYEDNDTFGRMAFYRFNNNVKLGSVVINILGIIDLARATDSDEFDPLLRELGNFTKFMAQEDGKYLGYYVEKGHPYHGQTNDIVPGEAALALVYLAEYFDDDEWIKPLDKYWEYYMPLFRKRAKKINSDAPWPIHIYDNETRLSLVQMGPWTVMAANAYHRRTGNEEIARFGLEVARWMIDTYQWDSNRAPWPDYVGGYYKLPTELPAMQAFCYAEGTAAAYQLAIRAVPEEVEYFEVATRESMRLGLAMQYTDDDIYAFSRPLQVRGGIRYALNETKVRIDYVHHGLSAMYQYYRGSEMDPKLPEGVKSPAPEGVIPFNTGTL